MAQRTDSHVHEESFKRSPTRVIGDTSGTVVLELSVMAVVTPSLHSAPGIVGGGSPEAVDGDEAVRAKLLWYFDVIHSRPRIQY